MSIVKKDYGQSKLFSGNKEGNKLQKLGDINFWVNSENYNVVEMTHHVWLLAMIEALLEKNGR